MRQYRKPPLFAAPQPSIDFICIPIAHLITGIRLRDRRTCRRHKGKDNRRISTWAEPEPNNGDSTRYDQSLKYKSPDGSWTPWSQQERQENTRDRVPTCERRQNKRQDLPDLDSAQREREVEERQEILAGSSTRTYLRNSIAKDLSR